MREIPKLVDAGANRIAKEVSTDLIVDLINLTPVDTSNALSNWQAGQTYPILDEINPYYMGVFGSTHGPSTKAAINVGKSNIKRKLAGTVLYISNNAPYIGKLNAGTSKQAPAGFVDAAVLRAAKSVRAKKLFK